MSCERTELSTQAVFKMQSSLEQVHSHFVFCLRLGGFCSFLGAPACHTQLTEQRPQVGEFTVEAELPREVTAAKPCQSTQDFRSSEMSRKVLKKKKTEGSVLLWKGAGTVKPQREKLEGGRGKPRTSYHTALHYFITFKRVEQSPVTDFSIFTRLFQNLPVSLYSLQTKAQFRAESIIFHPKDFPRLTEPHMAM